MEFSKGIPIDPATGFPELPEGHVWQIFANNHGDSTGIKVLISLETVHKYSETVATGWFKREIRWKTMSTYTALFREYASGTSQLPWRMERVWKEFQHYYDEKAKIAALVGTYPPKKNET